MNQPMQTGNCRLYSAAGVYGCFDETETSAIANCRGGRDQLPYSSGHRRPSAAVAYGGSDVLYPSVEARADLYDSRSRCRDELGRCRPADYRLSVTSSAYFGGGSASDVAYPCSVTYSTSSMVHGDCYRFQTAYGAQTDFGGCGTASNQRVQDCAVAENDRRFQQSSTLDDVVQLPSLQPHQQQTAQHHQQQQPQLARPTTYKWMTVKRGPPKTASGKIKDTLLILYTTYEAVW